jgi:hypothetical protein
MPDESGTSSPIFSNKVYDQLKFLAQIVLPALAVFYISLAPLWDMPKQEEVAGTIMAIDFLLGTVLGLSKKQYDNSDEKFDGTMLVGPGKNTLVLNERVENLEDKKELVFKVSS